MGFKHGVWLLLAAWAVPGLAAVADGASLRPGLYRLQLRPVATDAEQTDLRAALPVPGPIDGRELPLHQCLRPRDVASLTNFARSFQQRQPGRCETTGLDGHSWRMRCEAWGTQTVQEGVALIEPDRFAAHLSVMVGDGPAGHLLATGVFLGADCAAANEAEDDALE